MNLEIKYAMLTARSRQKNELCIRTKSNQLLDLGLLRTSLDQGD